LARILVVDDDDLIRKLVVRTLERAGYEVEASADGQQAARQYRKEPADLIITDLFMPEKEGMEIIMELRRDHPDVKIIAISGAGSLGPTGYLEVARMIGASSTLAKPFGQEELLDAVRQLIGEPQS
jgi:two-component system, chemotaxis family, chemotaxis protein CheY